MHRTSMLLVAAVALGCSAPIVGADGGPRACGIDLDCPTGQFCRGGVCASECVVDSDCSPTHGAGSSCDARGRCSGDALDAGPLDARATDAPPSDTGDGGSLDAGPGDAGRDARASSSEICNFLDDDGDGSVDEDHDWVIDPWTMVVTTTLLAEGMEATLLSDGRVAVAIRDAFGSGSDTGQLLVTTADGTLALGPLVTSIVGNGSLPASSVALGPAGEIAALYGSTDYAGCVPGCRGFLARADGATLGAASNGAVDYGGSFVPALTADLAWTAAGYVVGSVDTSRVAHVSWLTAASVIDSDVALPGANTTALVMEASTAGLAWMRARATTPSTSVEYGILSADGTSEILAPTIVASAGGATLSPYRSAHNILDLGGDIALLYENVTGTTHVPQLVVRSASGATVAGPVALGRPTSLEPADAILVDGTIVVLAAEVPSATYPATLLRLDAALDAVSTPSGPNVFPSGGRRGENSVAMCMVSTGAGILLFRATGGAHTVDAARVHCAP